MKRSGKAFVREKRGQGTAMEGTLRPCDGLWRVSRHENAKTAQVQEPIELGRIQEDNDSKSTRRDPMRLAIALIVALLASTTLSAAQSINIDLGQSSAARPSDAYRGVGLPGYWNKFPATDSTVYSLYGLDGHLTSVTLHQIGGTEIVTAPGGPGQPTGSDGVLLRDALVTHTTVENCLFYDGLQSGTYEVVTYAWMPTSPATPNRVHLDNNPTFTTVGGAWTGAQTENVTFARHVVTVTGAAWIRPHSGVPSGGNYTIGAALNGIQIRRLVDQPPLFVGRSQLEWLTSLGATSYDVVRGDLGILHATGGNFTLATVECLANNATDTRLPYTTAPAAGQGYWFLVRGVSGGGPLTWDEPGGSQVGSRDAEINAASATCP